LGEDAVDDEGTEINGDRAALKLDPPELSRDSSVVGASIITVAG